jgi:hypothetical protein
MDSLLTQTFTLLTNPPGNLIYHLVLVFSVAGALQSAFNHWRSSEFPQARRALMGLTILLVAQLTLFAFSGLAIKPRCWLATDGSRHYYFGDHLDHLAMGLSGTKPDC